MKNGEAMDMDGKVMKVNAEEKVTAPKPAPSK